MLLRHPAIRVYLSNPLKTLRHLYFIKKSPAFKEKLIFTGGPPRCGTTLIQRLVAANSHCITMPYEMSSIITYRLLDEPRVKHQAHLSRIDGDMLLEYFNQASSLTEYYRSYYNHMLKDHQGSTFVDSFIPSKLLNKFVYSRFTDARFVYIVRDPRDAYCSAQKHERVRQGDSASEYANYWSRISEVLLSYSERKNTHFIKYEDLALNPAETMQGVMKHCGIEYEESQIDPNVYSQLSQNFEGVNHHENLVKPISGKSIGRWRKELSKQDVATIERIAGRAMDHFGYLSG